MKYYLNLLVLTLKIINMKKVLFLLGIGSVLLTSCTSVHNVMREPNTRLELTKSDFNLSDQVSATASTTRIIGIDFKRIFTKKTGAIDGPNRISISSIPVIGNLLVDKTANYALYELMQKNPNYDVVLYPQYETKVVRPFLGIGLIYNKSTVKTTARLGQLKK